MTSMYVRKAGDPLTRPRPLIRDVIVASTEERAWEIASETVLPSYYDTYVESEHVLVGRETSGAPIRDPRDLAADRLIVGDPARVTKAARPLRRDARLQQPRDQAQAARASSRRG